MAGSDTFLCCLRSVHEQLPNRICTIGTPATILDAQAVVGLRQETKDQDGDELSDEDENGID